MRLIGRVVVISLNLFAAPLVVEAQPSRQVPRIGFLSYGAPTTIASPEREAFRQGLRELGWIEGQTVTIEYRWAEGNPQRLPALARDLVQLKVDVIVTSGTGAVRAAKEATSTIPIVFESGSDPVRLGFVANLNRPGGNVTGASSMVVELGPKRLELLRELLPTASVMAFLVNPADGAFAQTQVREMLSAARYRKVELHVLNARSESDFDAVFADIKRLRVGGLVIAAGSIFIGSRKKLADLTMRHAVPTISQYRDFAVAGGLMSYGSDILEGYRLAGVYTGRVLKGENPAELPVVQATKFELVINLKTAKALAINVPPSMQARADEMIE